MGALPVRRHHRERCREHLLEVRRDHWHADDFRRLCHPRTELVERHPVLIEPLLEVVVDTGREDADVDLVAVDQGESVEHRLVSPGPPAAGGGEVQHPHSVRMFVRFFRGQRFFPGRRERGPR